MIPQIIGRGIGFSSSIKYLITGGLEIGVAFDIVNIVALDGVFDRSAPLSGVFSPGIALAGSVDPTIPLQGTVNN